MFLFSLERYKIQCLERHFGYHSLILLKSPILDIILTRLSTSNICYHKNTLQKYKYTLQVQLG